MAKKLKTLTAKNPSEAAGIRKAFKHLGVKFQHVAKAKARKTPRKRNPRKRNSAGLGGSQYAGWTARYVVSYLTVKGKKKLTLNAHSREEAKELARKRIGRLAVITDVKRKS